MMKYQDLYNKTIENGGATWNPRKDKYLTADEGGFIVGEVVGTYSSMDNAPRYRDLFDSTIDVIIAKFPEALVGTWLSNDVIHIDPVRRFASKDVAIGFGIAKEQAAIYDVELGRVIGIR